MSIKNFLSISMSLLLASLFLSATAFYAVAENLLLTFLSCFMTWNSYIVSHKLATGRFIDKEEHIEVENLSNDIHEILKIILSSLVLIFAILIGTQALRIENFLLTFIASVIFWMGYILTHYCATGEIL